MSGRSCSAGRAVFLEAQTFGRHEYLDLVEPAYLNIGDDSWAEFAFGAVQARGQLQYSRTIVFFRWNGFDEGDGVSGNASAELQDDGSLEIELSFDNGDDAALTAHRA